MVRLLVAFLMLFLPMIGSSSATDTQEASPARDAEAVQITSDHLVVDDLANRMTFAGNVIARQGDVAIYAEEMTIVYHDETREIERIEAQQDVRIVQGDKVATGDKGVFYRAEQRIVLTGSPKVHQGEDFVEGEEIIVYLGDERSVIRGEEGARVNAVFHPKGESR